MLTIIICNKSLSRTVFRLLIILVSAFYATVVLLLHILLANLLVSVDPAKVCLDMSMVGNGVWGASGLYQWKKICFGASRVSFRGKNICLLLVRFCRSLWCCKIFFRSSGSETNCSSSQSGDVTDGEQLELKSGGNLNTADRFIPSNSHFIFSACLWKTWHWEELLQSLEEYTCQDLQGGVEKRSHTVPFKEREKSEHETWCKCIN